ncbi:MAG TPA: alpha/beta hydrolase [Beijerinckiaceae bacterium]|nr:alpha/beta hydrolase [Beijerinckiaceae bacterium]
MNGKHRPYSSSYMEIRGVRYHLRTWNEDGDRSLVFLHGTQDNSATFQFLVDHLSPRWRILAPDWRGFGRSEWVSNGYFFQDYVADLDAILDHLSPGRPATLVGHSLGGNVASVYSGVVPERVERLVSLDGFGLPNGDPDEFPDKVANWLQGWRDTPTHRPYRSLAVMAARLRANNPRLDAEQALFLATERSVADGEGGYIWSFDPRHRIPFPTVFRFTEWAACFRRVTADVLWVRSGRRLPPALARDVGGFDERLKLFARAWSAYVPDTSHNLHHDAPAAVAEIIEPFLEGKSALR